MSKGADADEEISELQQPWESDEMWNLRRRFLETYWTDARFTRNRLLCLSQILVNIEFLNNTYNEKLTKQVSEMAVGMLASRRERRKQIVEKVFVKAGDNSTSNVKNQDESRNLKRKMDATEDESSESSKKRQRPEMVDLGGGFWRQLPSAETPATETKLKSMQLLKAQISIAPSEMKPLELLNYACNRCKFEWSIEFSDDNWKCTLKIENVVVVRRHYWGDDRRSRFEACEKANSLLQRNFLDVRENSETKELELFTSKDNRKSLESPDDGVLEPLTVVLKSVKRFLTTKETNRWRTSPRESLQNACKSENVPFDVVRLHLGGWREDVQAKICGEIIYAQQGKVPPKGKEHETPNEICLKTAEILTKLGNDFKTEKIDGKLTFTTVLEATVTPDVDQQVVATKNDDATTATTSTVNDVRLVTLKRHLNVIDKKLNSVTRLDQACAKSKVTYEATIEGAGPFQCVVKIFDALVGSATDNSKKDAKRKACEDALNNLEKVYVKFIETADGLILRGSDDPAIFSEPISIERQNDNQPWSDFVLVRYSKDDDSSSAKRILYASAAFNRKIVKFVNSDPIDEKVKLTLHGVWLADGCGATKKEAEECAAKRALEKLGKICHTILIKSYVDETQDHIDVDSNSSDAFDSHQLFDKGGIAAKLMAKMGWSGGGMGRFEQGVRKPVELNECFQRRGFGSEVNKKFRETIQIILDDYIKSSKLDDLIFAENLSSEQRKFIHQLAAKKNLRSRSYNMNNKRMLTISKRQSASELLNYLLSIGGENGKYKIILPETV